MQHRINALPPQPCNLRIGRNNFIFVCILAAFSILLHFIVKQQAYPSFTMGGGPNTGFRTVAYYVNWCVVNARMRRFTLLTF